MLGERTYIKSPSIHPFGILLCKRPGTSVRYYYDYKSSSCCNQREGSFMEKYHAVAWQLNPRGVSYHAEFFWKPPASAAPRPPAGKHPLVAWEHFLLRPGNGAKFTTRVWLWLPRAEPVKGSLLFDKFQAPFFWPFIMVRKMKKHTRHSVSVTMGTPPQQLVGDRGDERNTNRCDWPLQWAY